MVKGVIKDENNGERSDKGWKEWWKKWSRIKEWWNEKSDQGLKNDDDQGQKEWLRMK